MLFNGSGTENIGLFVVGGQNMVIFSGPGTVQGQKTFIFGGLGTGNIDFEGLGTGNVLLQIAGEQF